MAEDRWLPVAKDWLDRNGLPTGEEVPWAETEASLAALLGDSVAAAERERDEERRKRDEEFAAFESAIAREREVRRGLVEALEAAAALLTQLSLNAAIGGGSGPYTREVLDAHTALAAAAEIDREQG